MRLSDCDKQISVPINSLFWEQNCSNSWGIFSCGSNGDYYVARVFCVTEVLPHYVLTVNLGGLLLQALLEYWPRTHINPMDEEENEINHG